MEWYGWVAIGAVVILIATVLGRQMQRSDGPRGSFSVDSPRRNPKLPPDLEQQLRKLMVLHLRRGTLLHVPEARAIGQQINASHGYDGMVDVCDVLRHRLGHGPYSELEMCWDGIGEWQS